RVVPTTLGGRRLHHRASPVIRRFRTLAAAGSLAGNRVGTAAHLPPADQRYRRRAHHRLRRHPAPDRPRPDRHPARQQAAGPYLFACPAAPNGSPRCAVVEDAEATWLGGEGRCIEAWPGGFRLAAVLNKALGRPPAEC